MNELNERLWRGRAEALLNTIEAGTQQTYRRRVTKLVRQYGGCGYAEVLQYILEHSSLARSTLLGMLSAVVKIRLAASVPMKEEERGDLSEVIEGIVCRELRNGTKGTRKLRGDLDEQKLSQVCGLAHEHNLEDIADGFVVMWGICCRPRDMGELRASQVDLKREVVLVRRKTWRKKRMREGEYEAHPIATRGARMLLSRRMTRKGLLFPGWCSRRARAVLKAAAQRYGWEACLLWDGAHTARHGAAADAMAAAIRATRERGGWRTDSSARHYGSLARRGVQKE